MGQHKALLTSRLALLKDARKAAVDAGADALVARIDNRIAKVTKAQERVETRMQKLTTWAARAAPADTRTPSRAPRTAVQAPGGRGSRARALHLAERSTQQRRGGVEQAVEVIVGHEGRGPGGNGRQVGGSAASSASDGRRGRVRARPSAAAADHLADRPAGPPRSPRRALPEGRRRGEELLGRAAILQPPTLRHDHGVGVAATEPTVAGVERFAVGEGLQPGHAPGGIEPVGDRGRLGAGGALALVGHR